MKAHFQRDVRVDTVADITYSLRLASRVCERPIRSSITMFHRARKRRGVTLYRCSRAARKMLRFGRRMSQNSREKNVCPRMDERAGTNVVPIASYFSVGRPPRLETSNRSFKEARSGSFAPSHETYVKAPADRRGEQTISRRF
jgi:hypothetical protein